MIRCWKCRFWDAEVDDRWPDSGACYTCQYNPPVILGTGNTYGEWPSTDGDQGCAKGRRLWSPTLLWWAVQRVYWRVRDKTYYSTP